MDRKPVKIGKELRCGDWTRRANLNWADVWSTLLTGEVSVSAAERVWFSRLLVRRLDHVRLVDWSKNAVGRGTELVGPGGVVGGAEAMVGGAWWVVWASVVVGRVGVIHVGFGWRRDACNVRLLELLAMSKTYDQSTENQLNSNEMSWHSAWQIFRANLLTRTNNPSAFSTNHCRTKHYYNQEQHTTQTFRSEKNTLANAVDKAVCNKRKIQYNIYTLWYIKNCTIVGFAIT